MTQNNNGKGGQNGLPFTRKVFLIPRAAEFIAIDELAKLIGHAPDDWLEVVLKEVVDNALDDAEEHGIAPAVEVAVDTAAYTVTIADQGSGIDPETVAALANLMVRVSSRAGYVSPSRGAQGNAWQTLIAMPYALDPDEPGDVMIEARGVTHRLSVEADPVERVPRVVHERERSPVKNGTRITIRWPKQARSLMVDAKRGFLSCAIEFSWLNPHLALKASWDGENLVDDKALEPSWTKWLPSQPESPHWYSVENFSNRIADEIAHAEKRGKEITVRDFANRFRGLSSTGRRAEICEAIDASNTPLRDFFTRGRGAVTDLLTAMQATSTPVKPRDLGVIGRDNIQACMAAVADADTFHYRAAPLVVDRMPYMIEVGFAYGSDLERRHLVMGLNFSPAIGGFPFRQLVDVFIEQHVSADDPVALFVHIATPRFNFTDKGKAAVKLPDQVAAKAVELVTQTTTKWKKQYEAEIRTSSAALRRAERLARQEKRGLSKKDAAYSVIERAYMEASSANTLPATARQVYYPSRRMMLPLIKEGEDVDDNDFTQRLLPDFMADNPELTAVWDVTFDDRGSATEPHTGRVIDLGTVGVRDHLKQALNDPEASSARLARAFVETFGPRGRYSAVLFIEKEGFEPLIRATRIRDRFDVLTMSTKGYSNTASRKLVDVVCGELGLPLFVLHDFDRDGFGIRQTLVEDGRRYSFENEIGKVVDLGLRLDDVHRLNLDSEVFALGKVSSEAARDQLRRRGATDAEIAFLIDGQGVHDLRSGEEGRPHRVELNAMTSRQFVDLIEEGFARHGVAKIVPDAATIGRAFAGFARERIARPIVERWLARLERRAVAVPADLEAQVRGYLAEHPDQPWDTAVRKIAGLQDED
jgi:DNA topoisomerase VI subunit B